MNRNSLYTIIKIAGGAASGIIGHHYGGQLLEKLDNKIRNTNLDDSALQPTDTVSDVAVKAAIDLSESAKLAAESAASSAEQSRIYMEQIYKLIKYAREDCAKIGKRSLEGQNTELISKAQEKLEVVQRDSQTIYDILKNELGTNNIGIELAKKLVSDINDLGRILEEVKKSSSNFISDFNFLFSFDLNKIYNYLDTLTLQQEGALLHIIILLTMLVTIFNILGIFFGNEIIKYFNLENKFPKLSNFLKLRAKLQRYYLMWNVFILFVLCIGALGINILVFIVG